MHAHGHEHAHAIANSRRLAASLGLTVVFLLVEAATGLATHSLALLSDAGHNVTDAFALGLSWYAISLARRPAHGGMTFGYQRAGIFAALINAAILVALTIWILAEAVQRLQVPAAVAPLPMIVVAAVAVALNAGIAVGLHGWSRTDLNVRSAFIHMAGDALAAVGVIVAGVLIALTGRTWFDSAASIVIGAIILWSSWGIIAETTRILLEGTPRGIDTADVVRTVMAVPGVLDVHDLHVWSISSQLRALSAHILVDDQPVSDACAILSEVNCRLERGFRIGHTSLQLETTSCNPEAVFCNPTRAASHAGHAHAGHDHG